MRGRVHDYHNMKRELNETPSVPKSVIEWNKKRDTEDGLIWINWIYGKYYRLTCKDLQIKLWTKAKDYVTWVEVKMTKELLTQIRKSIENEG